MIYYLAALSAAALWAISSMVSKYAVDQAGALAFNKARLIMVWLILAVASLFFFDLNQMSVVNITTLLISGFIGVFIGDTSLFIALSKLGPRRTQALFATSAPQTVILGVVILNELLQVQQIIGIVFVFIGVILVVFFNKKTKESIWEKTNGNLCVGIFCGLFAGFCQAIGLVISKPIMIQGFDPIVASCFRVGISVICFQFFRTHKHMQFKKKPNLKIYSIIFLSGFLGMGLGMTLVMFALQGGESGIVATLSSTSQVLVLPLLWFMTKRTPPFCSWVGAILTVIGIGLLFINL